MTETAAILREPWPDIARQREGVSFGIWVFIATEILFFGALFLGYAVYRSLYPEAFRLASEQTELFYGALNTVLLLTSSFTMTVAVRGAELGYRRTVLICLTVTALLGCCFLIGKGLEYHDDLVKNLYPGAQFPLPQAQAQIFWAFYWVMTGIHAVHLTVGIGIVSTVIFLLSRRTLAIGSPTITVVAFYWHFVDVIWIILVPLLYMAGHR